MYPYLPSFSKGKVYEEEKGDSSAIFHTRV